MGKAILNTLRFPFDRGKILIYFHFLPTYCLDGIDYHSAARPHRIFLFDISFHLFELIKDTGRVLSFFALSDYTKF